MKLDDEVLTLIDNGSIDYAAFYQMRVNDWFKFLIPYMMS
jgi:hypothetical protein